MMGYKARATGSKWTASQPSRASAWHDLSFTVKAQRGPTSFFCHGTESSPAPQHCFDVLNFPQQVLNLRLGSPCYLLIACHLSSLSPPMSSRSPGCKLMEWLKESFPGKCIQWKSNKHVCKNQRISFIKSEEMELLSLPGRGDWWATVGGWQSRNSHTDWASWSTGGPQTCGDDCAQSTARSERGVPRLSFWQLMSQLGQTKGSGFMLLFLKFFLESFLLYLLAGLLFGWRGLWIAPRSSYVSFPIMAY